MTARPRASRWRQELLSSTITPAPAPAEDPTGVGGTAAVRRWPWALLAAVLGALGGAVVAVVVRRQPAASGRAVQEPHELRAVVDKPPSTPA